MDYDFLIDGAGASELENDPTYSFLDGDDESPIFEDDMTGFAGETEEDDFDDYDYDYDGDDMMFEEEEEYDDDFFDENEDQRLIDRSYDA